MIEQIEAAIQQGAALLIVGPMGEGKARLIQRVLSLRPAMTSLLIIDQHGAQSDISVDAVPWARRDRQPLSDVLPNDGSTYPVVHALTGEVHLRAWMAAAAYHGGIATMYSGSFEPEEIGRASCRERV